jgi:SAM-dependent methyltransferase
VDKERLRIAFDEGTMELYSRFLAWIGTTLDEPRESPKLLDIGCSVGSFLTKARSQSYDVRGLEIGEASAAYARSEHRLDVRDGSVYDCDFENGSFDVISMLEVIEHLEDPKEAIRRVSNWVAPGGVLFLTTPNFNSLYRRLYGSNWWVVNCEDEHIYFFTISSLTSLIEEFGFDVKFVATRGFDIAGMLKQLFRPKAATDSDAQHTDVLDYYETRSSKEKIKRFLGRIGALQLVRSFLRALDWLASQRWSPIYGLGEQLIIIGTRRK